MSHVQRELRQQRLRIPVIAVGLAQGLNGEGMPNVMDAGDASLALASPGTPEELAQEAPKPRYAVSAKAAATMVAEEWTAMRRSAGEGRALLEVAADLLLSGLR